MTEHPRTTLQDVAKAALGAHAGVSGRELERVARRQGLTISYTTINGMAAGTYKSRPTRRTLDALADLSGYSREAVYAAAELPLPGPPFADELPPDVDRMHPHQRRAVIEVIRAFLADSEPHAAGSHDGDRRTDVTAARGDEQAEAARTTPDRQPTRGQRRRAGLDQVGEESQDG
jgi:hypothetical protein